MTLTRFLALLALTALLTPPCLAAPDATPLRVGVVPISPPMIFKEGKNIVGVEADFAQALGKALNRPITFVELKWDDLFGALDENRIDIIMSSLSVTAARRFRVLFSEPYLRIGQMMLVRADEQFRFVLIQNSLADTTIGLKKATTGDLLVQQEFPRAKRKYFNTGAEAAEALRKKKIDLFINDSPMVYHLAGMNEAKGLVAAPVALSDEMLAWGMRRSDTQLCEAVNAFLKTSLSNGDINKVLHRWIPNFR